MNPFVETHEIDRLSLDDLKIPQLKKFIDWYKSAEPNSKIVYYEGSLAASRGNNFHWKLKLLTWSYACNGWVYLVQRKISVDIYQYIAIKASTEVKHLMPVKSFVNRKVSKWLLNQKQ